MKKQLIAYLAAVFLLSVIFLSCQDHEPVETAQVFKVGQEPATLKYPELHRDQINWVFKSSPDDGPAADEDGSRHSLDKQPRTDVVQLVGTFGGKAERSLVIPRDRYIFANVYTTVNWYYDDDACDPNYHPAPGQSSLDFLKETFQDLTTGSTLTVKLNGKELLNNANRVEFLTETEVFPFKPHKDFDYPDCDYTAKTAKGYSEGYDILLKLPPGSHTLLVKASTPATADADAFETEVLWHLTVQ